MATHAEDVRRHNAAVMRGLEQERARELAKLKKDVGKEVAAWTPPAAALAPRPAPVPSGKKDYGPNGDERGNGVIGAVRPKPGLSPEEIRAERKADPKFQMTVEDHYGQRD